MKMSLHHSLIGENGGYEYNVRMVSRLRNLDASFNYKKSPFCGSFDHANLFFLHLDEDIAVVYFCQPIFFVLSDQDLYVLARNQSLQPEIYSERLRKVLLRNDITLSLKTLDQSKCMERAKEP